MSELIEKYFPGLTSGQREKFRALKPVYDDWNSRINVISRRDMDNFYLHHVLHSLAIAKITGFVAGTSLLDAGTGGGFPGIPLAILFPDCRFTLMDSIQKKIKVVSEVASILGLKNVVPLRSRVEEHSGKYDFVISRAVTSFPEFVRLVSGRIERGGFNTLKNGILYLKGADILQESGTFAGKVTIYNIGEFIPEPFFETKRVVYLPM
jgi:16S rRNA (guanine527-N7)-methyltransferase